MIKWLHFRVISAMYLIIGFFYIALNFYLSPLKLEVFVWNFCQHNVCPFKCDSPFSLKTCIGSSIMGNMMGYSVFNLYGLLC